MKANFKSTDFELPGLVSGQVIRVRQGSAFSLTLAPDQAGQPMPEIGGWWADEDPVLVITKTADTMARSYSAASPGTSEVLVFAPKVGTARALLFSCTVEVFNEEAVSLDVTLGPNKLKPAMEE